jgi:hypothetical protein
MLRDGGPSGQGIGIDSWALTTLPLSLSLWSGPLNITVAIDLWRITLNAALRVFSDFARNLRLESIFTQSMIEMNLSSLTIDYNGTIGFMTFYTD